MQAYKKKIEGNERRNQRKEEEDSLSNATFNPRYKEILIEHVPKYLTRKGNRRSQQTIARFRCGCEELQNRYWIDQD